MTIDLASFGYGVFAATCAIGAGSWVWYRYAPLQRDDARDAAIRKLKTGRVRRPDVRSEARQ